MENNNIDPRKNQDDELRDFMIVVRQAILMIAAYIEKRYIRKR